jgi:hypothetical protein
MGTIHLTNGVDGDPLPIPPDQPVTIVEQTHYLAKQDVFVYGNFLIDNYYDVEVVSPGGKSGGADHVLGISDPSSPVHVSMGHFDGGPGLVTGPRGTAFKVWDEVFSTGNTNGNPPQGYDDTDNPGGEYQVVLAQHRQGETQDQEFAQFSGNNGLTKSKNFKIEIAPHSTSIVTNFILTQPDGLPQVNGPATSPDVTSAAAGSTAQDFATVTVTDSSGIPVTEGTVNFQFFEGTTLIDDSNAPVINGQATDPFVSAPLAPGSYYFTAGFSDGADFGESQSDQEPFFITQNHAPTGIVTNANPSNVTLPSDGSTVTLNDSANIIGTFTGPVGGTITFNLYAPGDTMCTMPIYTQTVSVSGYGTYSTGPGFTLPTAEAVTGTYQWVAQYSGSLDSFGNGADPASTNCGDEPVVVSPANPSLVTTASPAVTLGTSSVTISDTAVLSGGYNPTGSINFTLMLGSTTVYTTSDPVSGNGSYGASYTLPTSGTVTGTYTWSASYTGDGNNNGANDQGGAAEQTVVSPANPSLVTTASPAVTLGTSSVTISDTAVLSGGYNPTGSINFTLMLGSTTVYTTSDPVSGNGSYSASYTLPTSGTVTGTYSWLASYSGDSNNNGANDQGGAAEQTVVSPANPSLVTTASAAVTLGTSSVTISDTAVLSGGYNPTGSINFTLMLGSTTVYTTSDTVSGNGSYSASYTLPTSGTVTGTYTWSAHYSGDGNNNAANDQGGAAEQTVVSPANPSLVTTASAAVTLGTSSVTISDTAVLSGGYNPTGSINFALKLGSTTVYTTSDTVSGNGSYSASYTLPTSGTVTGTYTWSAHYSGDGNNNAANDQGGAAEQTVVSPANPTLVTMASPAITLGTTAPTIADTAVLSGGYHPTGSISFTLKLGSTTVYTTGDSVSGNGSYSASYTLPTSGAVAGTYTWSAHYSGDSNNNGANDQGGTAEQTVVNKAQPTIVTASNPTGTVNVGNTAITVSDTIVVSNGYYMTGSLKVSLSGPTGFTSIVTTVALTGTGNGTYTVTDTLQPGSTPVGTYTWTVSYLGDANNKAANDQSVSAEQFTLQNVISKNEAATLGYWANNNGQALLKTYTGTGTTGSGTASGSAGLSLGYWLAKTWPNLFGNFGNTTTGATGANIAAAFITAKNNSGSIPGNLYLHAFNTALDIWVTTGGLGWGTASQNKGFMQGFGGAGLGSILYNVGSNGAAFGVANNTLLTVNQIMNYLNSKTSGRSGGSFTAPPSSIVFYGNNTTLENGANNVLDGIDQTGDII